MSVLDVLVLMVAVCLSLLLTCGLVGAVQAMRRRKGKP